MSQSAKPRDVTVIDRPPAQQTDRREQRQPPPMHAVVLWNNATSDGHRVAALLVQVFQLSSDRAMDIVMAAHRSMRAVVGVFTADVAEALALRATAVARAKGDAALQFSTEAQ